METDLLREHIYLIARIALSDALALVQLMSATAAKSQIPETDLWNDLLNQWWRLVSVVSQHYAQVVRMI